MMLALLRRVFPERKYATAIVVPDAATSEEAVFHGKGNWGAPSSEEDELWAASLQHPQQKKPQASDVDDVLRDASALASELNVTIRREDGDTGLPCYSVRYSLVVGRGGALLGGAFVQVVQSLNGDNPGGPAALPPAQLLALSQLAPLLATAPLYHSGGLALLDLSVALLQTQAQEGSGPGDARESGAAAALESILAALLSTGRLLVGAGGAVPEDSRAQYLASVQRAVWLMGAMIQRAADSSSSSSSSSCSSEIHRVCTLISALAACLEAVPALRAAEAPSTDVSLLEGSCMSTCLLYWRLHRTLLLLLDSQLPSVPSTMPPLPCLPSPSDLLDETRHLLRCAVPAVLTSTASTAVPGSVARSGYALAGLRFWLASAEAGGSQDPRQAAWIEAVAGSLEVVLGAVLDAARQVGGGAEKSTGKRAVLRPEAWTLLSLGPVLLEAAAALHARAATATNTRAMADGLALQLGGFLSAATEIVRRLRPSPAGGAAVTGDAAAGSKDAPTGLLRLEIGTINSTSSAGGLTTSAFSRSLSSVNSPQHSPQHAPLALHSASSLSHTSNSLASSQGSLTGLLAQSQSLGGGARGGGSSFGAASPAGAVLVDFRVGDRVDGLCMLSNGTSRWFPAVVTAVTEGRDGGAGSRYCLQYNDGDVGTDMARIEVRLTKSRQHASGNAAPTVTISAAPAIVAPTPAAAKVVDAGTPHPVRSAVPPPGPSPSPIFKPDRCHALTHALTHAQPEPYAHMPALPLSDAFDSDSDNDDNVFEIPSMLPTPSSGLGRSAAAAAAASAGSGSSSRLLQLQLGDIHSQAHLAHGPGAGLPTSSSLSSITLDAQTHTGHGPGAQAHHLVATASGTFMLVPEFAEERLSLHSASTLSRPPSSHRHYHTSDSYTYRDIYTHRSSSYTARGATPTMGATRFDRPPSSSNATTRESLRPLSRDLRAGGHGGGRRDPRESRGSEEGFGQTSTHAGAGDDSGTVLTAYTAGSQCTPPAHLEESGYTRVVHGPSASGRRKEEEREGGEEGSGLDTTELRLLALLLSSGTLAAALCVSACSGKAEGGEGEWGEGLREDLIHTAVGDWPARAGGNVEAAEAGEAETGPRSLVQAVRDWLPESAFLHAHIHSLHPAESSEASWKAGQQQLQQAPQLVPNPLSALYSQCGARGRRLVTLLGLPPLPSVPQLEACLGRRLGVGAHGSVYRADVGGGEEGEKGSYAVKRLPRSGTGLAAVVAEVAALQRLAVDPSDNPNNANKPNEANANSPAHATTTPALAAALTSFGVVGEEYWLVLQRGGCSLTALRADFPTGLGAPSPAGGASPWALLLLELFLECGLVLRGVHSRGVAHFDVKADNFLVTRPFERAVRACLRAESQAGGQGRGAEDEGRLDGLLAGLREAHKAGRAQGVVVLVDFGESLVGAAAGGALVGGAEGAAGANRVRGTLPIQAPEMLAVTTLSTSTSTSSTPAAALAFPAPSFPCDAWSLGLLGVELLAGRFLLLDCSWAELYVLLCVGAGRGVLSGLPALLAGAGLAALSGPLETLFAALVEASPAARKDVAGMCVEIERAVGAVSGAAGRGGGGRSAVAGQAGGSVSPRPAPRPHASLPSSPPMSAFAGWLHLPPSAHLPLCSGASLVMLAPADQPPFAAPSGLLDLDAAGGSARGIRFTYLGADGWRAGTRGADGATEGGAWMVPVPEGAADGEEIGTRDEATYIDESAAWSRVRAAFVSLLRGPLQDVLLPPAQRPDGGWGHEGCYYPLLPVYLAVLAHACRAQLAASGLGMGLGEGLGSGGEPECLAVVLGAVEPGGLCDAVRGVPWVGLLPPHSVAHVQHLLAAMIG